MWVSEMLMPSARDSASTLASHPRSIDEAYNRPGLHGELLARPPHGQKRKADALFRAAIKLAKQQGATALEHKARLKACATGPDSIADPFGRTSTLTLMFQQA